MVERIRRLRRDASGEAGLTLVELMVTTLILGIALSIVMSIMFSVQKTFGRQSDRSLSNDQARLAVEEIDREIRSGNLLYSPTSAGMNLIVYTQTNAPTRNPSNRSSPPRPRRLSRPLRRRSGRARSMAGCGARQRSSSPPRACSP